MNDAASFKNEAELNSYLEQFIGQLRLPSESIMNQLVVSCFDMIEQYMPKQEAPARSLSLKQVALLYIYSQKSIDGSNATAIALKYGHHSGVKLRSNYNTLLKKQNCISVAERQASYMIENIEAIKCLLSAEALAWAEREEQLLKSRI